MTAERSIAKGEPLYDTYGAKGNMELFRIYGFVPERAQLVRRSTLFEDVEDLVEWFVEYAPARVARPADSGSRSLHVSIGPRRLSSRHVSIGVGVGIGVGGEGLDMGRELGGG